MKKRLPIIVLITVLTLILGLSLSACSKNKSADTHTHTFAAEWSNDADYHWHAATCGHNDAVADKAAHTWNEGVITTAPTEDAGGVKTYTCTVCGRTKTEDVAALSHVWQADDEWTYNETNHWHACANCDEHKDEAAHTLAWKTITEATYKAEGSRKQVCSVCGYETAPETVAMLEKVTPVYTVPTGLSATCGQTLADVTLPDGFSFESALTTSVGAAGNNAFTVKYVKPNDEEEKYKSVTGISVTVAVAKASASITPDWANVTNAVYSGAAVSSPAYEKTGDGTVTVEWYDYNGSTYTLRTSAPVNAGSYKVKLVLAETENYNGASVEKTFAVSKADGAVAVNDNVDKTYDGTAKQILTSEYTVTGDGAVTVLYKKQSEGESAYSATAPTAAGSYVVKITLADGANYNGTMTVRDYVINKAATTITTAPVQSGTNYIGQTLAAVTLSGGAASVAGTFGWKSTDTVITSTSAVYAVTFTPTDSANYSSAEKDITVAATQLSVTVTVGENGKANVSGVQNVNYGSNLNVTFTPDSGKTIDEITVDDVVVASALNYQFSNITANHTLSVTFKDAATNYNLTLTVTDPDGKATVLIDGADKSTGFAATPYSYGNHTYAVSVSDTNYEIKSIKVAGVEQLPRFVMSYDSTVVLMADNTVEITIGLQVCEVTIGVFSWDGNYPCADKLTIVSSIQQEYTKTVDIPFTISDGYTIYQITCGSTYYNVEAALAAGKIVLDAQNAATANLKIYVEPKSAKITLTKSYLDDDAKNCHDNSTAASVYTAKFSDKLSCYISWNYGVKAHIYKNGDTANDLYSTFFVDRPESNTDGWSNYYIPYEAKDVAYEIVFYTEYNTITFTGEHVHLSLDGGTTAAVAPIKIIKHQNQYINILLDAGYQLTALTKDGADILSTLDNEKQFYIAMNDNVKDFTLAATTERINYTLTVNNYKAEYFDTFKIYGKPTADSDVLTEKIGVVDTVANTMTYTFDWHEYVGKAEVTFAAAYETWDNNSSCVYICGTSFTGKNETTSVLYYGTPHRHLAF